jgi:hypothetical protein
MLRIALFGAVALAIGGCATNWDPAQHGLVEDNTPSIEAQLGQLPMEVLDAKSIGKLDWKSVATHPAWRSAPRPDWRGRTFPDDPWRIARWHERFFPGSYLRFELQEDKRDRTAHRIVFQSTAVDETDCATFQPRLILHYGRPSDVGRVEYPQPRGTVVLDEAQWKIGLTSISFYCVSAPGRASVKLDLLLEPSGRSTPLLRATGVGRIP